MKVTHRYDGDYAGQHPVRVRLTDQETMDLMDVLTAVHPNTIPASVRNLIAELNDASAYIPSDARERVGIFKRPGYGW